MTHLSLSLSLFEFLREKQCSTYLLFVVLYKGQKKKNKERKQINRECQQQRKKLSKYQVPVRTRSTELPPRQVNVGLHMMQDDHFERQFRQTAKIYNTAVHTTLGISTPPPPHTKTVNTGAKKRREAAAKEKSFEKMSEHYYYCCCRQTRLIVRPKDQV